MGKKILSFCMLLSMVAMLSVMSSCSKEEEIEVPEMLNVEYHTVNGEDVYFQYATANDFNNAFRKAVNQTTNTVTSKKMAEAVKSLFKSNLQSVLKTADLQTLRRSNLYFYIKVTSKSTGEFRSEAKLYGNEL